MNREWQGVKNVVVVGLGITGLSVVRFLQRLPQTLSIRVIDTRANPPGQETLSDSIELHCGSWNTEWLQGADLLVVNPGIALSTPQIQSVIERGIRVVGDIELFAWHVDKPVVAITGSNGKSTVTDLAGVAANAAGIKTAIGGNIGVPALDLLETDSDLYILELSSFQLETTHSLQLKAAAFLNLSEDHMDRYQGMEDYRRAKLRIFDHAETAIVNLDDQQTHPENLNTHPAKKITFSVDSIADYYLDSYGSLMVGDRAVLKANQLSLVGRHNAANVLVVMALLNTVGANIELALEAIRQYSGLSHRCQLVTEHSGVMWVNDSKATNVASTLAALTGLGIDGKLYLLVGGDGKGADFSDLAPALEKLNHQLCCFGRDGERFLELSSSSSGYDTIEDVLSHITPRLNAGDMVMLSPACASFDQFSNFMARGDAFIELARRYSKLVKN